MSNPFKSTVSKDVVESFLSNLANTDLEPEIVEYLKDSILDQGKYSEATLRSALFNSGEDD